MKKLLSLIAISMVLISCFNDDNFPGPPGPQGPPGQDGVNIVGQTFETTVDFTAPDYSIQQVYPTGIQVLESDVVLAYLLWEEAPASNGGTIDVWRPLPQTRFTDTGIFSYNFDFTFGDYALFLEAESGFDFNTLQPADLQNQTFRIVVVPSDFASLPEFDPSDMNKVLELIGQ